MDQSLQPVPPQQTTPMTDGPSHKCEETLKQVLLMLDHELSENEQQSLMADLQRCDDCLKKYNLEKDFKAYMHGKFVKKACTEQLRARIQDIVRTQIN